MNEPALPRGTALLRHFAGASLVLAPFIACILAGSVHASLWLDEILYWSYERDSSLRAIETMRPGSRIAHLFMNYFYCDIQRVAHWFLRRFGLTLQSDPELYLRFLSLVAFIAIAVFVYGRTFRESRSWSWSVTATLALSASPLLLFYAFEARVSALATLGVIVDLALLAAALQSPNPRRLRVAGAILGIFLGHLHVWIICLFAGLLAAAMVRFLVTRNWQELWTVAAFALPGAITATTEAAFITFTYPAGGHSFPLYLPRSWPYIWQKFLAGAFAALRTTPPALFRQFFHGTSIPLLVLAAAIVLVSIDRRRSPLVVIPVAAVVGLLISLGLGAAVGYLIIPRYLVPLFGAILFSLTLATTRPARLCVALLAAVELALIPTNAVEGIALKGNGKQIGTLIETEAPLARTAVIVQQSVRLGYPDPLHNFVLHFYLDELHPERAPVHIFELPSLKDITDAQGVRDYFGGGQELAKRYVTTPEADWERWLSASPVDRIWFVVPAPVVPEELQQFRAFSAVLARSGFTLDRRHTYVASGYPLTQVGLFVRQKSLSP